MTDKNLQILKDYYKKNNNKVNGMKLKKWFENEHPEIKNDLENFLLKYPNLTKISNIMAFSRQIKSAFLLFKKVGD